METQASLAEKLDPFVDLWARVYGEKTERRRIDADAAMAKQRQVIEKTPAQVTAVDEAGDALVFGVPVNRTLLKISGGLLLLAGGMFIYKKLK